MKNVDNSLKAKSGALSKKTLKKLLDQKKEEGIVRDVQSRKFGYDGKRKDQFKCDYLLTFCDGSKWLLFSARSLTSDRLKTKQWDAYNIKEIDDAVEKAYVICPNVSNVQTICRYRGYIRKDLDKSSIDDILFLDEFREVLNSKDVSGGISGSKAAKNGLRFEREVKTILENDNFLDQWKANKSVDSAYFRLFEMVMCKLGLIKDDVYRLSATTKIPQLPEYKYKDGSTKIGGSPKTDVALTVYQKKEFTFSCKNAESDDITVFEFPAKYCAEILGEKDLEDLLIEYEKSGGPQNMKAVCTEKAQQLEEIMSRHIEEFHRWVLRGTEKHYSEKKQLADYIIVYKKNAIDWLLKLLMNASIESRMEKRKGISVQFFDGL